MQGATPKSAFLFCLPPPFLHFYTFLLGWRGAKLHSVGASSVENCILYAPIVCHRPMRGHFRCRWRLFLFQFSCLKFSLLKREFWSDFVVFATQIYIVSIWSLANLYYDKFFFIFTIFNGSLYGEKYIYCTPLGCTKINFVSKLKLIWI